MTTPFDVPGNLPPAGQGTGHFHTTRWTRVARAKETSHEGQDALRELCGAYYAPVLAFLRWQGRDADAAREVAHEFFAYMLKGGAIRTADRIKGRFRSYLLGAVKHFLSRQQEAARCLRRGGGAEMIPITGPEVETHLAVPLVDESQLSPDMAFDRQWALTVLERALRTLGQEWADEGRQEVFAKLQPWLTGESGHGDQKALAEELGMNLNSLKTLVHRLKQRFRSLVREEVSATLEDGADVEAEIRVLFNALRKR